MWSTLKLGFLNGSRYSRIDQVRFVEDSLKIWKDIQILKSCHLKFFRACLPQILLAPFLNTLTQMINTNFAFAGWVEKRGIIREYFFHPKLTDIPKKHSISTALKGIIIKGTLEIKYGVSRCKNKRHAMLKTGFSILVFEYVLPTVDNFNSHQRLN